MASLNRVTIMGNLGQDPELRYTASQTPVCSLSVATTDYRTTPEGQRQEMTEWHRVVVWSKTAELCAKYLTKGRSVLVEGRLQTRSWEDKQGQKRYVTEIVASNVQFIGGGRDRPAGAGQGEYEDRQPQQRSGGPRGAYAGGGQGGGNYGGGGQDRGGHQGGGYDDGGGSMDSGFGGPETPGLDDIPF
jgi:single-strand DNA-binding protein